MNSWSIFFKALRNSTATWILVGLNAALYIAVQAGDMASWLWLSASMADNLIQPWRFITYMFVQQDPLHLLGNLVPLLLLGVEYERRRGAKAMLAVYFAGGLAGAAAYMVVAAGAQSGAALYGSSAAVLALLGAVLTDRSNRPLQGIVVLMLFMWSIGAGVMGSNPGGAMAHIAGLVTGVVWGMLASARARRRNRLYTQGIIDKAKTSGYSALTNEEKKHLSN